MLKTAASLILFAVTAYPLAGHAQLFKCKDANGKTSYQETPCAAGEQKRIAPDKAPDGAAASPSVSGRSSGTDRDKRIALDRAPSKETMESCVKHHRPDLIEVMHRVNLSGRLSKRIWQTNAGPSERLLVAVSVSDKNQPFSGALFDFTCVLRGDETADPQATREFSGS